MQKYLIQIETLRKNLGYVVKANSPEEAVGKLLMFDERLIGKFVKLIVVAEEKNAIDSYSC